MTGCLAALSLTVTAYGSAFDAARWNAGRQLVATGVPATDIDAGFEWSGYHAPNGVDYAPADAPRINWYSAKFADNRPCFAVTSSAQSQPNWRLLTYGGLPEVSGHGHRPAVGVRDRPLPPGTLIGPQARTCTSGYERAVGLSTFVSSRSGVGAP